MLDAPNLLDQFSKNLLKDSVDIITFAESPAYCGLRLYPRQRTLLKILFLEDLDDYDKKVLKEWQAPGGEVTICPDLEYRMDYLKKNGYKHFRLIQLVGGRRSSKSMLAGLIIAYKVYQLVQLDNPGTHYGIEKNKDIYFSIVADSLDQAKAHQFGDAVNFLLECKPLRDQGLLGTPLAETMKVWTPYDKRRASNLAASGVRMERELATLQVKAFGTNSKTIRGSASIVMCFDEMAHLIGGESRMSDEELYKAAIPSLAQFGEDAMIIANSSPYTKTGKFYELYENALELDPPGTGLPVYPDHFMLQFPSWELYKDWEDEFPAALIQDPDNDVILAREELSDPASFKVEYRGQFDEVVDAFLRPEKVDDMFDPDKTREAIGRTLEIQPGASAYAVYKGHADPSSEDANFGIAIAHVEEIPNPETGAKEQHVIFDLIDAFYPDDFPNNEIDYLEVVPEIVRLVNNFRPFEFTFDQFNSVMPIQEINKSMRKMGIGDTMVYEKTFTAQNNLRRAKNFRTALNLGRVHAPHPSVKGGSIKNAIELVRNELKFLQMKNGKVVKQDIGPVRTKDIADCVMECVDALIGDSIMALSEEFTNSTMALGAHGGFSQNRFGNTEVFEEFGGWYHTTGRIPPTASYNPARGLRRGRRRY